MMKNKHTCSKCNGSMKRFRFFKGNFYCYKCFQKSVTIIPHGFSSVIKLEEALNRTYTIKAYRRIVKNKENLVCLVNFPTILAGKMFKIVVVGEVKAKKVNIK